TCRTDLLPSSSPARSPETNNQSVPFSFECYRDHRDLHSFPTRRSSDLGANQLGRPSTSHQPTLRLGRRRRLLDELNDFVNVGERDRKSTRLNSSHRTNSYAVFCSKKKQ